MFNCRFVQERLTPLDIEKGENLTHLKRVRKSGKKSDEGLDIIDIVLCSVFTLSQQELQSILKDSEEKGIEIKPRIEQVSRWPAYNTKQLFEFRKLWPVSMRMDSSRYLYCRYIINSEERSRNLPKK